ncbi:S-layer homology domain-containing protein [Sedimentibacter sp.]|uniref:S-layer homology domain-containing protein n=1 Tax=Sedimentibacter sp. TaxID=1960295 RepID=UPI00289F569A|nr:S-layer homology domain-containing protein [Sedimentibacter sp.]
MKKVLSLVLVIAMVLSSMSFAFGAKFEDTVDNDYAKAIDTLAALGVINGYEDGTFRPGNVVTRAEMAKLLVEILGYGDLVAGSKSNFTDTQGHWADAWIALAAGKGLVVGTGDGKFTPDRTVSYDEAITMVVRGLGYTDGSNELKGMTWPTNFKVKAAELKLTKNVDLKATGADRGGVAQLLFNALDAILVTVDSDGNIVYVKDANKDDKPLLSRIAEKVTFEVNPDHIDADHKNYKGDVEDLSAYMFQTIVAYEKDDVVVYVKESKSLTVTGTVTASTTSSITVEDAKEDEYKLNTTTASAIDFMYNGEEATYASTALTADEAKVTVVLKGESGDKLKDGLEVLAVVATQASGYVQVEDTYKDGELVLDAITLPKDGKVVDTDNLVIKGAADSLEDIKEDDVLAVFVPLKSEGNFYTKAPSKMTIVVARDTVEGRLTKITSGDYYIDGKAYELNSFSGLDTVLEAGDEGVFYLDHEGKLFAFDAEGSNLPDNYALVLDTTNGYRTTSTGGIVLADPKIKLLTAAGEKLTYVIDFEEADVKNVTPVGQNINVGYTKGDLVIYDTNSDNEINELDAATVVGRTGMKTDINSFNLAKNAVIFNVPGGDPESATVIVEADLDDTIDANVARNSKNEIAALVVTKGGAEKEGIFALITKDNGKGYDADAKKEVQLFTSYVDGEKVEYLAHKDIVKTGPTAPKASNVIVELVVSGGKLKDTKAVADSVTGTAINSRVTSSIKTVAGPTVFLSDDVVVYVIKASGAFDKVGTVNDIRNNDFVAYDTVDADKDYDVVVVFLK